MSYWNATDYDMENEEILTMATNDNMDLGAGGVKFDAGKIRMDLVPPDATMAVATVFSYGAIKYDDWNWAKGMRTGRIMAAMQRHQAAYMLGEELDEESGLPHLWHMGCCAMMMIAADLRCVLDDDRPATLSELWQPEEWSAEEGALNVVRDSMHHMNDPIGTPKNAGGTINEEQEGQLEDDIEAWFERTLDEMSRYTDAPEVVPEPPIGKQQMFEAAVRGSVRGGLASGETDIYISLEPFYEQYEIDPVYAQRLAQQVITAELARHFNRDG